VFEKRRFELVTLEPDHGRACYEPDGEVVLHVGRCYGAKSCQVEHIGMVVSGCATAAMDDAGWSKCALAMFFISAERQVGGRR